MREGPLAHEALTGKVLEAAYEVSNELGIGFLESVYAKALAVALRERGLRVEVEYPIEVHFHGESVGHFIADMVVEGMLILELKAVKTLAPEHSAQTLNYLKATGWQVALLINFGTPRIEVRRFDNRFKE